MEKTAAYRAFLLRPSPLIPTAASQEALIATALLRA
jgi:hypothetical protein